LDKDSGKPSAGDVKANTNIIKRTLANFGIVVEMDEVSIGPSITRYALKPAEGVKLSKIVALQNDLSLALAAHPIRIEAPIPGKSLVGIEIPNATKSIVGLGSLLGAREFAESTNPLLVALGRGISGISHFANIAKAPHLLIAGATGSGKSVTIHTLITSLLYRNPADQLRFIMIDPKRVELTLYNRIPHLLTPVVTDPKKAILVLKWAAKEMERRYNVLESHAVRDIQSYHKNILATATDKAAADANPDELPEKMPYIVIIIDELADIMSTYPRELEAAIVRLAQMSRAVGIHLILSTQRPSVEVITGLIKANIPTRVALQVASQIDSRTILDQAGAEKLLGAGDMLYLSGDRSKPARLQSAYISEEEVKAVVDYLAKNYQDDLSDQIVLSDQKIDGGSAMTVDLSDDANLSDDDDLYEEARQIVIEAGKASASYLQRKLKVGYARAARLLDMLEERGVIGPGDGAKQREVYEKTSNEEAGF
jgi:S-DNA-T family DNA segregation ATPase FtsK/SpoIIIE